MGLRALLVYLAGGGIGLRGATKCDPIPPECGYRLLNQHCILVKFGRQHWLYKRTLEYRFRSCAVAALVAHGTSDRHLIL